MKEILIPLNFTTTPTVYDTKQSFSTSDEASGVLTFTTTADVAGTVASLTIRNASENANRQTVLIERLDVNSSPFSYTLKNPLPFGQYEGTVLLKKNLTVLASATFLFGVNSSLSAEVLPDLVKAYSLDELVENVETEVSNLKDAFNLTVSETVKGVNKTENTLQAQENVRYLNEHTRKTNEESRIANEQARIVAELERKDTFDTLVDSAVIEQTVVQEVAEKYQEIEALNAPEMVSFRQQLEQTVGVATTASQKADAMASGSPKGVYATLALLQAAYPTGTTGAYLVTADGNWYYWSGSAWASGGVYQSGGVADESVNIEKTFGIIERSENYFDADSSVSGLLTYTTGVWGANASYMTSDYIPVKGLDNKYFAIITASSVACFYDKNKVFMSGVANIRYLNQRKIPVGAYYMRFSTYASSYLTEILKITDAAQIADPVYIPFDRSIYGLVSKADIKKIKTIEKNVNSTITEATFLNYVGKQAVVTFIDDDCDAVGTANMKALMDSYGFKCSFACITNQMIADSAKKDLLLGYQAEGYDILNHSAGHSSALYNVASPDWQAVEEDMLLSKKHLRDNGFFGSDLFVYPYGIFEQLGQPTLDKMMALAKKHFECAFRGAGVLKYNNINNAYKNVQWYLERCPYNPGVTTYENMKYYVDQAVANGGWIVILTHSSQVGFSGTDVIPMLVDYISTNNIQVKTMSEVWEDKKLLYGFKQLFY